MRNPIIVCLLIVSVGFYFYTEVKLILNIANFNVDDEISGLIMLSIVRFLSSLSVVILMVVLSTSLAHQRRLISMNKEWMRNDQIADLLPSYLLTVFEQLIAFYYLARLRVIIDTCMMAIFIILLLNNISTNTLILISIACIAFVVIGSLLYFLFSLISHKTTETENELVECAKLINERGSHGWEYIHVNVLMKNFSALSLKLNKFLTIRYSISGALRVTIEFVVFILVALGIIITKSTNVNNSDEPDIIMLLVFSRIAPILFSIFSQVSTLGFGDSATKIYFSGR